MVSLTMRAGLAGMVCMVEKVTPSREILNGAAVVKVKASFTLTVFNTTSWTAVVPVAIVPKSSASVLKVTLAAGMLLLTLKLVINK